MNPLTLLKRLVRAAVSFWRRGPWQKVAVGAVLAAVTIAAAVSNRGPAADTSIAVTRGSIEETVSVTGQVVASVSVDLSFGASGRIARVSADVGDAVVRGQLLASLDSAELSAQLRDAQATVLARQAQLEEMELGGSPEEVAIAEASVRSARESLQSTYDDTYRALSDAYANADYALRIRLQPLFERVSDSQYRLTFDTSDYTREAAAVNARGDAEEALLAWDATVRGIAGPSSPEAYRTAVADSQAHLQRISAAVTATAALFDGSVSLGLETDTEEDYRSRVNSARTDVTSAITTVNGQDSAIRSDTTDLERAERELAYTANPSTPQALAAQRAAVLSAQAAADRIVALIAKNAIRSPIDGIVTRQDAKVGQTAAAGEVLVSVIAAGDLEVEANVPEVDIGRVSVDDRVRVTVDALPGETFTGAVAFIEPAETVVDGVVNFKVTFALDSADPRLKSGLTVNLDIVTERRDGVLLLPQFAIIESDDGTFVRGLDGAQVPVVLGIRSQDGAVEVVSGLSEGSRVQNIGLRANGK